MFTTQDQWDRGYADGRHYRPLSDGERSLLATHGPTPVDARALVVGCGVGELAAHLSTLGYAVDAVDWSEAAVAEASARHGKIVRWLRRDVESAECALPHDGSYDLITLRFVYPFLNNRDQTVHALGRRLSPGGALVVVTPLAAETPAEWRGIALDEGELAQLQLPWPNAERHDTEGLAFVVLRGPHPPGNPSQASSSADGPRPARAGARHRGPAEIGVHREHHFSLLQRYYGQVESGRKTIEARVATPKKADVQVADTIVFHDQGNGHELDVVVKRITAYASFDELLDAEDPVRIDPDASRAEQLVNLRRIYPPEKETLGALAFEFDHRPGRPGRPLPMAPADYVQTVPHHTLFGCLYVRDEHDRPVQLRSVYGSRDWQLPGGVTDTPGEDPLETARRETAEETGLTLGQGTPRLLLTHYQHPGPRLPLGRIGFIFDGGRLTAGQLSRIRLDPAEHDMWAIHDLSEWQRLMGEAFFARLDAIERARRGQGPNYYVSGPQPPLPAANPSTSQGSSRVS
ncbi:methyltransferase domain-containing protein [Streptomyces sp. NPDC001939]